MEVRLLSSSEVMVGEVGGSEVGDGGLGGRRGFRGGGAGDSLVVHWMAFARRPMLKSVGADNRRFNSGLLELHLSRGQMAERLRSRAINQKVVGSIPGRAI